MSSNNSTSSDPKPALPSQEHNARKVVDHAKGWPGVSPTALRTAIDIMTAMESIHFHINAHFGTFGVSRSRLLVLKELFFSDDTGLTPAELADRVFITRPSMTVCLDGLEKASYVRRVPSATDRRTVLIQITDAGRAYIAEQFPRFYTFFSQVFSSLNRTEQKTLTTLITKLDARIKKEFTPHDD